MSFVKKDLDILKSKFEVDELAYRGLSDAPRLFLRLLKCDVSVAWFGKLHAFFAVLFSQLLRKKIVVVTGGDDVAKETSLGRPYGIFGHPIKRHFGNFIFRHSDLNIVISLYNYKEVLENTPAPQDRIRLVTHGFDSIDFAKAEGIKKLKIVATVGHISYENCWRKGFYLIKEAVALIPEVNFYIIGPVEDDSINDLKRDKPDNLILTGALYGDALLAMLERSQVYLQVSEWESFGCALAEAMLCECVPVVFRGTSLPEVVGDCGYYIEKLEAKELVENIRLALTDDKTGLLARERIKKEFPLEKRREEFLKVIEEVAGNG